jgi:hypothetical protein
MVKIKYMNIPILIGKIFPILLIYYFIGYILYEIPLYIILSIVFLYFVFNLITLVIIYTKKTIYILKYFDKILLILFTISFIVVFILILIFIDPGEAASHGALFTFPLGVNIVYFFIAYAIDRSINEKINTE